MLSIDLWTDENVSANENCFFWKLIFIVCEVSGIVMEKVKTWELFNLFNLLALLHTNKGLDLI